MARKQRTAERKNRRQRAHAGEKPARAAASAADNVQEMTRRAAGAGQEAFQDLSRQGAEVLHFAGTEAAGRVQEAAQLWTELAQDALRQNMETAQNLLRCRTMTDVVEVQSDWVRRSLDNVLGRGSRLGEISAQLAVDTVSRFGGAAEANVEQLRRAGQRASR